MTEPDLLTQVLSDAYDETPYKSDPLHLTAPGHLRAVAHLYGLAAPALENARVLELGCAAGGNLLPFAAAHPNATVVGIDLAPLQITAGQQIVEKLGIRNLDLRALSITDIDASFGQFDYIICHGVFSWVPPEVRDAILRVCRENLAPEGIAYISYNTYPGWKASDVVRDAMMLNSFAATTPKERLARAKEMLGLLEHGLSASNPLRDALQQAARNASKQTDYYLLHEHLASVNSPCYFLEFVAAIQQAGLTYITDADPRSTFPATFGENVAAHLQALSVDTGREMREQYLDFAMGRQFRMSLITHGERAEQLLERPEANRFGQMRFAAQLTVDPTPPQSPTNERRYRSPLGSGVAMQDPSLVAITDAMREVWPGSISFAALVDIAKAKSPDTDTNALEERLFAHMATLMSIGSLLYRLEPVGSDTPATKPTLIPGVSRLLSGDDRVSSFVGVYNLWHQVVARSTDPVVAFLANRLDGTRSLQQLRTDLRDALVSGQLTLLSGDSMKGARNLDPVAQELLMNTLSNLRKGGLLL